MCITHSQCGQRLRERKKETESPTEVTTPMEWTPAAHVMSIGLNKGFVIEVLSLLLLYDTHTNAALSHDILLNPECSAACAISTGTIPSRFCGSGMSGVLLKSLLSLHTLLQTPLQPSHKLLTTSSHIRVEYVCCTIYYQENKKLKRKYHGNVKSFILIWFNTINWRVNNHRFLIVMWDVNIFLGIACK